GNPPFLSSGVVSSANPEVGVTATAGPLEMARRMRAGRWIDHWEPEDGDFWQRTGRKIANRNLLFSVLSEHIGFSVWTLWSVLVLFMGPEYGIDAAGKFFLVSVPTLVGAVLRLPYTFAVARFGGQWPCFSLVGGVGGSGFGCGG